MGQGELIPRYNNRKIPNPKNMSKRKPRATKAPPKPTKSVFDEPFKGPATVHDGQQTP